MPAGFIEFISVAYFLACLYHSWTTEGRRYALQWFLAGYYFAILWLLLLVQFGQIAYSGDMLLFGSAPSLIAFLVPAVFYTAYFCARAVFPDSEWREQAVVVFLASAAAALPFDASALQFGWWSFPSDSLTFLNGVPHYLVFAWALTGTLFFLFVRFVRRIPLRGSGQFFALVLATPLVSGLALVLIAILQIVVNLLGLFLGDLLFNLLLALILLGLPLYLTLIPAASHPSGPERGD